MIGAAASTPSSPPAPAATSAGNRARAGVADSPRTGAGVDGSPTADNNAPQAEAGKEAASASATAKRDAAADGASRDAEPASDFADLLAACSEPTPAAALPSPPEPLSAETTATGSPPDQLLALLSGSWALPAAAAPPSSSAPAPTADAPTPHSLPAAPVAGMPFALALVPANAASADSGTALAALGELAGSALASSNGGLAANPVDASSFDSTRFDSTLFAATAPTASPLRAEATTTVPGPPLTLSDNADAGFEDGLGARIAWMAEQRVGHAEIRLNPDNVGPIDVRVQLDGTRVSAEFHSAHTEVRQAIEASVPRLREMLGQQGLQLGHADVGQRHAGQGQGAASPRRDPDAETAGARPQFVAAPIVRSRGLLDEYA